MVKAGRKLATPPYILIIKAKNSVTNVTVLVTLLIYHKHGLIITFVNCLSFSIIRYNFHIIKACLPIIWPNILCINYVSFFPHSIRSPGFKSSLQLVGVRMA